MCPLGASIALKRFSGTVDRRGGLVSYRDGRKGQQPCNFHSWAPAFISHTTFAPGASRRNGWVGSLSLLQWARTALRWVDYFVPHMEDLGPQRFAIVPTVGTHSGTHLPPSVHHAGVGGFAGSNGRFLLPYLKIFVSDLSSVVPNPLKTE